jgi:hypothetical protein
MARLLISHVQQRRVVPSQCATAPVNFAYAYATFAYYQPSIPINSNTRDSFGVFTSAHATTQYCGSVIPLVSIRL